MLLLLLLLLVVVVVVVEILRTDELLGAQRK